MQTSVEERILYRIVNVLTLLVKNVRDTGTINYFICLGGIQVCYILHFINNLI